jgi:hypothetical protein
VENPQEVLRECLDKFSTPDYIMEPGIFTQLKRFIEVSLSTADSSCITPASTENLEFVYPLQFSLPYFIEESLNALNICGVQASCVMKLP